MAGIFVEGIKRSRKPFPGTWEQAESAHQEDTQQPHRLRFEETQGAPRGPQVASVLGTLVESVPKSRSSGSVWW